MVDALEELPRTAPERSSRQVVTTTIRSSRACALRVYPADGTARHLAFTSVLSSFAIALQGAVARRGWFDAIPRGRHLPSALPAPTGTSAGVAPSSRWHRSRIAYRSELARAGLISRCAALRIAPLEPTATPPWPYVILDYEGLPRCRQSLEIDKTYPFPVGPGRGAWRGDGGGAYFAGACPDDHCFLSETVGALRALLHIGGAVAKWLLSPIAQPLDGKSLCGDNETPIFCVVRQFGWCGVSHHTPARYFRPTCNLPERDSLFWLFPRRLDPFSLYGSSIIVLGVPQLWPLTRIRSIVQDFSTPV
jgi:hypothetical protein